MHCIENLNRNCASDGLVGSLQKFVRWSFSSFDLCDVFQQLSVHLGLLGIHQAAQVVLLLYRDIALA